MPFNDHLINALNGYKCFRRRQSTCRTSHNNCTILYCATIRYVLRHTIECRKSKCSLLFRIASIRKLPNRYSPWQHIVHQKHSTCFVNEIVLSLLNMKNEQENILRDQIRDLEQNAYATASNFSQYFQNLVEQIHMIPLECKKKEAITPLESKKSTSNNDDLNRLIKCEHTPDLHVDPSSTLSPKLTSSKYDLSKKTIPYNSPISKLNELNEELSSILQQMDNKKHEFVRQYFDGVSKKLKNNEYDTPARFLDDVRQIFKNIQTNSFYQHQAEQLNEFEISMNSIMIKYKYCCAHEHVFLPRTIICCRNNCKIPPYADYYVCTKQVLYSDRYVVCSRCFKRNKSNNILIDSNGNTNSSVEIPKTSFTKTKNDSEKEPMINCIKCSRRFHNICVLYNPQNSPDEYICIHCTVQSKTCFARELRTNELSDALEKRVNKFLRKECDVDTGRITIRVLAASDRVCEIKPRFKKHFGSQVPDGYPYRTKAIFAFQEIEGVDVVLFGMHVQEYDSRCPGPNAKRVYVSYLDSVHYFRPKQKRTALYYELLIGYLEYVKQLGFVYAHIWACPPSEGDDYIFYCHPIEQCIPTAERLQEWYKTMFDKALKQKVIDSYQDLFAYCDENKINNVIDLPYFDGDYWQQEIETLFEKFEPYTLLQDIYNDDLDEPEDSSQRKRKQGRCTFNSMETLKSINNQLPYSRKRRSSESKIMDELKKEMSKERQVIIYLFFSREI